MRGLRAALADWGLALAIVIAVLGVWSFLHTHPRLDTGPAPEVVLSAPEGEVPLSQLHGKVVVLNFWATWCGPCIRELPELQAFYDAHPDVVFYGVSVDQGLSRAQIEAAARRHGAEYPIVVDEDGQVSEAFKVDTFPTTVVIDARGQITAAHVGTLDAAHLSAMVGAATR